MLRRRADDGRRTLAARIQPTQSLSLNLAASWQRRFSALEIIIFAFALLLVQSTQIAFALPTIRLLSVTLFCVSGLGCTPTGGRGWSGD